MRASSAKVTTLAPGPAKRPPNERRRPAVRDTAIGPETVIARPPLAGRARHARVDRVHEQGHDQIQRQVDRHDDDDDLERLAVLVDRRVADRDQVRIAAVSYTHLRAHETDS